VCVCARAGVEGVVCVCVCVPARARVSSVPISTATTSDTLTEVTY
jgi:hypothetical protein